MFCLLDLWDGFDFLPALLGIMSKTACNFDSLKLEAKNIFLGSTVVCTHTSVL